MKAFLVGLVSVILVTILLYSFGIIVDHINLLDNHRNKVHVDYLVDGITSAFGLIGLLTIGLLVSLAIWQIGSGILSLI